MSQKLNKFLGGFWPFVTPPVFFWMTAEGILNFGGGEKDILLIIPVTLFSFLYLVIYIFCMKLKVRVINGILLSSFLAFLLLLFLTLLYSQFSGYEGG